MSAIYLTCSIIGIIAILLKLGQRPPIIRLVLLIIIFMISALIFIILDYYFLGLTYIIVYVGAISILFLFVIMMASNPLNISSPQQYYYEYIILLIPILLKVENIEIWNYFTPSYGNTFIYFDDIQSFGFLLYLAYPFITILLGLILWAVLIGIIVIGKTPLREI